MSSLVRMLGSSRSNWNPNTYNIIDQFISNKYFSGLETESERFDEICNNLDAILSLKSEDELMDLIIFLLNKPLLADRIHDKRSILYKHMLRSKRTTLNNFNKVDYLVLYIEKVLFGKKDINLILEMLSSIITPVDFFSFNLELHLKNLLNLELDELNLIKAYFNEYYSLHKADIIKYEMTKHMGGWQKIIDEIYDETYSFFFQKIFEELLDDQNLDPCNIFLSAKGHYSQVFVIGDKILKIGSSRYTHEIPNHEAIIQPLIRFNLYHNDRVFAYLEVMEKAKIVEVNDNELYNLYKNLRDAKIIWNDVDPKNVGILLKNNYSYLKGCAVPVDQIINGFDKNNSIVLPKGELVVIDTDYLYHVNDFDYRTLFPLAEEYEIRYNNEKNDSSKVV